VLKGLVLVFKKKIQVHQVWIRILVKIFWQWSIFHQFSCTTALQQGPPLLFIQLNSMGNGVQEFCQF